jgi:hypothetical protein
MVIVIAKGGGTMMGSITIAILFGTLRVSSPNLPSLA